MKNILQYTIDYPNVIYRKKLGVTDSGFLNNTPIINSPLNVKFSHFSMNKKYSYFKFFLTSPEHRYSSAGSNKIIKNICSGPTFQGKWL